MNKIKNTGHTQDEIFQNILKLHCPEGSVNANGEQFFEVDLTYSKGVFYKHGIPEPAIKMDVEPQGNDVLRIQPLGQIPLDSDSVNSIMFDPPFCISTGASLQKDDDSSIISKRFASYYPREKLFESYYHWIQEAFRILKDEGILVMKTQGTVSGGIQLFSPEYSWLVAQICGFYPMDQFFLIAKNRIHSGKIKKQEHARKHTSTIWVFKKMTTKKKPHRYFMWANENQRDDIVQAFQNNILK